MNGALQSEAIAHLASFVVYFAVLVMIWKTSGLLRCVKLLPLRQILAFFLSVSTVMCIAFMSVQSIWVLRYGFEPMMTLESVGWLIFDWLNGLAYLSFVSAIRLAILWKPSCDGCEMAAVCTKKSRCFLEVT